MSRLGAAQWSEYWKAGSITTFQDMFTGNYDREIGAFWAGIFSAQADGTRLVDLACGNGALALLAAMYSRESGRQFEIDALDFAEIRQPAGKESRELWSMIRFFPHRRLEDTGLESGAYQLAVSQFGIEYGERKATIEELDRILAPTGATLAFMCHRADSEIIRQSRNALQHSDICNASKAPGIVRKLQEKLAQVYAVGKDPARDRACEKLRARLNAAIGELHDAADRLDDPRHLHFFIKGCMAPFDATNMQSKSLPQRLALLDQLDRECAAFEGRMKDLLSAALDQDTLAAWERELSSRGFMVASSEPVIMDEKLFGHALVLRR